MSSTTAPSQPLAECSSNTSPKKQLTQVDAKSLGKPSLAAVQQQGQRQSSAAQAYISPSDTIMSPTTKKLEMMKGKRFANAKPQSLFAKTVSRQGIARSGSGQSFDEK